MSKLSCLWSVGLVAGLCVSSPSLASADEAAAPGAEPAAAEPAASETPAEPGDDEAEPVAKKKKKKASSEEEGEPRGASDEDADGVRFRGGVALEGGLLAIPENAINLGVAGVQGQIGVQITNLVGVYAVPGFDIVFGAAGGVNLSAALLVDFTMGDIFTVGVGPDVGVFAAIGSGAVAAGANYGGRIHLAVHPVLGDGEDGVRRKAFTIGLDTRLLGGPVASATTTSADASLTGFVLQPMLTLGYTAF